MDAIQSSYVENSQPQPPPPSDNHAEGGDFQLPYGQYPSQAVDLSNHGYPNSSNSCYQIDPQYQIQSEETGGLRSDESKVTLFDSRQQQEKIHVDGSKESAQANDKVASADDGGRLAKLEIQRPLLSDTGLTNTHSGTDRDQSGGEEETTSKRKRRS